MAEQNFSGEYANDRNTEHLPELDASVESYFQDLGLSWDDLDGKEVLDVGAGQARFAQAAKKKGMHVTSIDVVPGGYGHEETAPTGVPYITGDFTKGIDIPSDSFDLIVARASVHSMVEVQEDMEAVLNEVKRLLRPGGEFRFGPGAPDISPLRSEDWDKWYAITEKLEEGEKLTSEEDAFGAKCYPRIDDSNKLEETLAPLRGEERMKVLRQHRSAVLHGIEPALTEHAIVRTLMRSDGGFDIDDSSYFVLKKPAVAS